MTEPQMDRGAMILCQESDHELNGLIKSEHLWLKIEIHSFLFTRPPCSCHV